MKQKSIHLVGLYLHNYSAVNLMDGLVCTLIICIIYSFWLTFDPILTLFSFLFTILGATTVQLYFSCFTFRSLKERKYENAPNLERDDIYTSAKYLLPNEESNMAPSDAATLCSTLNYSSVVLTRNFVTSWYGSFSDSPDFIEDISPLIFVAMQNLCKKIQSIQVSKLIPLLLEDGLVKFIQSLEASVSSAINSSDQEDFSENVLKYVLLEKTFTAFEKSKFGHTALRYKNSLHKYIENIFDILFLASGLSVNTKQSDVFHYFLRDILSTNILERIIYVFSQPHILFHLINLTIDDLLQTISILTASTNKTSTLTIPYNYSTDYSTQNAFPSKSIFPIPNSRLVFNERSSTQLTDIIGEYDLLKHTINTPNINYHQKLLKGVASNVPTSESRLIESDSIKITHFDLITGQPGVDYYVYYILMPISFLKRCFNICAFNSETIPRRFREFAHLHQIMKSKYRSSYKSISFPSKFAGFANVGKEFICRRKYLLEQYLQSICTRDKLLKSPELQAFLGFGSRVSHIQDESLKGQVISYTGRQFDQEIGLTFEDIDLKFSLFITGCLDPSYDFLLSSTSSTISKLESERDLNTENLSQSQNIELTSNPTLLVPPNGLEFNSMYSSLLYKHDEGVRNMKLYHDNLKTLFEMMKNNKTDCAQITNHFFNVFPISTALYKFGVTLLRNKLLWVNREAFFILILNYFGENSEEQLRNKLQYILGEDNLNILIQILLQKYFPEGTFSCNLLQTPSKTDFLQLKNKTRDKIFNFIPVSVKKLVGENEIRISIQSFLDCLCNDKINSHLLLRLFDIFIKILLPEFDPQTFESLKT